MKLFRKDSTMAVLLAMAFASPVTAGTAARADAEPLEKVAIMRVDGTVVIDPSGKLVEFKLDTPLTPTLKAALDTAASAWQFEPVLIGGEPRRASTNVRVVLAATKAGEVYRVKIDNVSFQSKADVEATVADGELANIGARSFAPPTYPTAEIKAGAMGTVLLAVLVSPEGLAQDVKVVQSMLVDSRKGRSDSSMRLHIAHFERAAVAAAKKWTFAVPAGGAARTAAQMTARVPVEFTIARSRNAAPVLDLDAAGQWLPVIRLPKAPIPWLPAEPVELSTGVADVTGSGIVPLASAFKLRTSVAGTALQ